MVTVGAAEKFAPGALMVRLATEPGVTAEMAAAPVPPPPGVVYVQPYGVAPGPGWGWSYQRYYGWGWHHPHHGWRRDRW